MRAVRREVLPRLDLRTTGMEFASEMVIRAGKERLAIEEIPIHYHPREGESKLSSWRDGWRHLRFLLVHSPTWLFIVPGALMAMLGTLVALTVLLQIEVLGRAWDLHSMVAGALLMIVGTQVLALGLCAHAYGTYFIGEQDPWFDRMRARFQLEHGLMLGGAVVLVGVVLSGSHRRHLGGPGLRRAFGGAACRARGDVDHRRHPDLLLFLPDQHHRLAPTALEMAVRAVLGAGFALLLLAVGVTLAQSAPRQAGSNYVPEVAEVVKLRGDGRHCQPGQTLPEGAASLGLLVGTYGSPAPGIRVVARTRGGETVTRGRRPAGGEEGRLEIPVGAVDETTPDAVVCIRVATVGRTVLYGAGAAGAPGLASRRG